MNSTWKQNERLIAFEADILEGELGIVGRRRIGISIPEDMVVISLLVVTMEVIL